MDLQSVLARAQQAIARAKSLSTALEGLEPGTEPGTDDVAGSTRGQQEASSSSSVPGDVQVLMRFRQRLNGELSAFGRQLLARGSGPAAPEAAGLPPGEHGLPTAPGPALAGPLPAHSGSDQMDERPNPFAGVAARLASLHAQQASTLQQLLALRLEQLRLRRQQLSALQELLRSEVEQVEGTPLQMSAVQQALSLLHQCLDDMQLAAVAISASTRLQDVAAVAETVSRADSRAEEVSRMARQLLGVLREFPRRENAAGQAMGAGRGRSGPRGATEAEIAALPVSTASAACSAVGEACAICLSEVCVNDQLKGCLGGACCHTFHAGCLNEWLRVCARCPLCAEVLPCVGQEAGDAGAAAAEPAMPAQQAATVPAAAQEPGDAAVHEAAAGGRGGLGDSTSQPERTAAAAAAAPPPPGSESGFAAGGASASGRAVVGPAGSGPAQEPRAGTAPGATGAGAAADEADDFWGLRALAREHLGGSWLRPATEARTQAGDARRGGEGL